MATVTVFTAERMQEIEDAKITAAEIVDGDLILTRNDGQQFNAGPVRPDPPLEINGSRGGNAALESLLNALEADGWIVNNTTA